MKFETLQGLYQLASVFYVKGIVDANSICDPLLVEEEAEKDTLKLLINNTFVTLVPEDYIIFIQEKASSERGMAALYNYIEHLATPEIKEALCYLADYLYSMGLKKSEVYLGAAPTNMMREASTNSTQYITPNGKLNQRAWHGLLRRYIVEIKLKGYDVMEYLNEFMAVAVKNQTQINQVRQVQDERRSYILSGGEIPNKSTKN
jgi:hypothetical protein